MRATVLGVLMLLGIACSAGYIAPDPAPARPYQEIPPGAVRDDEADWITFVNHVHTTLSLSWAYERGETWRADAHSRWDRIPAMMRDMSGAGLDAVAFTEHNTLQHRLSVRGMPSSPFAILAEEFNTTARGHLNLFYPAIGKGEWIQPSNTREISFKEYRAVIAEVHRRGGVAVINHPFAMHTRWIDPIDTMGADAIEIDSSFPCLGRNTHWWHDRIAAEGRRIVAVSGSDYHYNIVFRPRAACGWLNLVRMQGRPVTEANLLEEIRRGHVMVSRYNAGCRKDRRVLLASAGGREGDSVAAPENAEIHARIVGFKGYWLKLYDETDARRPCVVRRVPAADWTVSFRRPVGGLKALVRADISDALGRVYAVTNPIYFNFE